MEPLSPLCLHCSQSCRFFPFLEILTLPCPKHRRKKNPPMNLNQLPIIYIYIKISKRPWFFYKRLTVLFFLPLHLCKPGIIPRECRTQIRPKIKEAAIISTSRLKAQRINQMRRAVPCQLEFYPTCTEGSNLLLVHSCIFYKQLDFKKGIVIRLITNINFLYRDFDGSEQTNEATKISLISCNIWAVNT